jgi:hypothetical protein
MEEKGVLGREWLCVQVSRRERVDEELIGAVFFESKLTGDDLAVFMVSLAGLVACPQKGRKESGND